MKILEKPLNLADVPARLIGNVGRGVSLVLEINDGPLNLVLPVQKSFLDLVGLRLLAGGRLTRGKVSRTGLPVVCREPSFTRDVPLERVLASMLVNDLLLGDLGQEFE